jgi:hypothetical protein
LPIVNPIALGSYTLAIDAAGYQPFVGEIDYLNPDGGTVTVRLIAIPVPTATATVGPAHTGTVTPVGPGPTGTAIVSDLPNTGAGDRSSGPWPWLLAIAGILALAGLLPGIRRCRC